MKGLSQADFLHPPERPTPLDVGGLLDRLADIPRDTPVILCDTDFYETPLVDVDVAKDRDDKPRVILS